MSRCHLASLLRLRTYEYVYAMFSLAKYEFVFSRKIFPAIEPKFKRTLPNNKKLPQILEKDKGNLEERERNRQNNNNNFH